VRNNPFLVLFRWTFLLIAFLAAIVYLGDFDGVFAGNNPPAPTPEGVISTPVFPEKPQKCEAQIIDRDGKVAVGPVIVRIEVKVNPRGLIPNPLYGGE